MWWPRVSTAEKRSKDDGQILDQRGKRVKCPKSNLSRRHQAFNKGDSAKISSWGAEKKEQGPHKERKKYPPQAQTQSLRAVVGISVELIVVSKTLDFQ